MRALLMRHLIIAFMLSFGSITLNAETFLETSESTFIGQYITETINDSLYVSATILTNGDVSELESLGLNIITNRFNIITLNIPYNLIDTINQLNSVIAIEFDSPLELTMFTAREWVDSERAIQTFDVDGSGVIIGNIDKYIEPAHPEFKNSSGDTRVLYYWDRRIGISCPTG